MGKPIGVDPEMLVLMLQDVPEKRPHPGEVVKAVTKAHTTARPERGIKAERSKSRSRSPHKKSHSVGNGIVQDVPGVPLVPAGKLDPVERRYIFWSFDVSKGTRADRIV